VVVKVMPKAAPFFLVIPCVDQEPVLSNPGVFRENLLVVRFHWDQIGWKIVAIDYMFL